MNLSKNEQESSTTEPDHSEQEQDMTVRLVEQLSNVDLSPSE